MGQGQQLRLVNQHFLGRYRVFGLLVVAETICFRFQRFESFHIGQILSCIYAARRERYCDIDTGILRCLFNTGTTCQHDQVGQRNFFTAIVEITLDTFEGL